MPINDELANSIGHFGKTGWGFPMSRRLRQRRVISTASPGRHLLLTRWRSIVSEDSCAKLASVNACGLIPESAVDLWATVPRNAGVVLLLEDAGASWTQVPQQQFFGTEAGSLIRHGHARVLDYGATGPSFG